MFLCGVEIWPDSLKTRKYCLAMMAIQIQSVLSFACSYSTVSAPAALMVSCVIPIDLLAFGHKRREQRHESARRHIDRKDPNDNGISTTRDETTDKGSETVDRKRHCRSKLLHI